MLHIYFLGKRKKPLEQQVRLLQDTDTVFKIISFFFSKVYFMIFPDKQIL